MDQETLRGLLERMTDDQRQLFKRAVVRQAIQLISKQLPPADEDEGHSGGIHFATAWLDEPTDERADAATFYGVASCWDGAVRYHDHPLFFLNPAWAAGTSDICKAAGYAVDSAPDEEREAARQWQIETASAILRGEEPLPVETVQTEP